MKVYIVFYEERAIYDNRMEGVQAVFLNEDKAKEFAEKMESADFFYEVCPFDVEDV